MTLPRLSRVSMLAPVYRGAAFALVFAAAVGAARGQAPPPRIVLLDDAAELQTALASATPPHELAVRLVGISVPHLDPAKAQLLIVAEIEGGGPAAEAGASQPPGKEVATVSRLASVSYVVEDERGQSRARQLRRLELPSSPGGRLVFAEGVALAPGRYRLKLAVMNKGRIGAANATVELRLQQAAGVRFGDLVVGELAGGDFESSVTADRTIRGDRLVGSVPFSTGDAQPLPDGLTVAIDAAKEAGGPALMSAPAAITSDAAAGAALARGVLDVRALPPGDYVARATVSVGGKEALRMSAPFTREGAAAATPAPSIPAAAPTAARPRPGSPPPVPGNAFRPEEVLDPVVLRPFLDELALRAPDRAKPAIEQAKAGRFGEAASTAAVADPNGPAKPFLQGLSLFSQKQLQAASESFRETLRAAPDYFVGAFYIGACYAAGGRDPQAVNAWQTSLVGLEHYPIVFRLLADAQTRMGRPDRALETIEEALAKWPGDGDVRLRAARAALDARQFDRVFTVVDEGLKGHAAPDLLLAGIQAAYEQVGQRSEPPAGEQVARARRYRDAYVAAGGSQQALVAEWLGAIERKR